MSTKRKYEGLANYLQPSGAPGNVGVVGLQPRQPVGPTGQIPGGFQPIPTSSQGPKRTNATIVYSRTAVTDAQTMGPLVNSFGEGDVVFTERFAPALKSPQGQNVKVMSMQRLNHDILKAGPMDAAEAKVFFGAKDGSMKFSPDGIVNNLDGADPENEYKDFAIANVAIQGFCRFSTLSLPQKNARNGDKVFLALTTRPSRKVAGKSEYRFELFLASHITTGKTFAEGASEITMAWRLGRVVDGNQSKNMITLCVGVEPVYDPVNRLQREWGSNMRSTDLATAVLAAGV